MAQEPIEWSDSAAWDVDWVRGMKCIDYAICGYVIHSVQDETLHMETAHKQQDNRDFRNN